MADVGRSIGHMSDTGGGELSSTTVQQLGEVVKGAFSDRKLDPKVHKKIMSLSSVFVDRVNKALR
eukprot:3855930-Karenia_brevis.AAC.1